MNALKKILIIDDLPELHLIYKMMLIRYQCEIISALNGQDGLDLLAKHPDVDLILLDINMPLMTGLDFIRAVKEQEQYSLIPIILISTPGMESDAGKGLRLGAQWCIKKPFAPRDLHLLLDKLDLVHA